MPATAWRLWLHERVSDRAHVPRRARAEDLRRDERDHEAADRAEPLMEMAVLQTEASLQPPPLTPPHKGEGDLACGFPSPLWGGVRGGGHDQLSKVAHA